MVVLMMAGSLLLHGGLVGIASLWTPPPPESHSVPMDIFDGPADTPGPINTVNVAQPNPPETPTVTATPEVIDTVPTPPPVNENPDFAEPSEQTPSPHRQTVVRQTNSSNRPTSTQTTARTSTGPSGVGTPGNGTNVSGASVWVTPHPPYPRLRGISPGVGQTTVQVTTDASGRVSNVVIVKSTGNPVLDSHTLSYVRGNWHGPANASKTTEFVYQVR